MCRVLLVGSVMSLCLSARARQRICFVCECLCGRAREYRSFVARPSAVTPDVRSLAGLWTGGFSFCWSHDRCFSQADVQLVVLHLEVQLAIRS